MTLLSLGCQVKKMSGSRSWKRVPDYPRHPRHVDDSQRSTNQPFYNPSVRPYDWPPQNNYWMNQSYNNSNFNPGSQMWPSSHSLPRLGPPVSQGRDSVTNGRGSNHFQPNQQRFQNSHISPVSQSSYSQINNHMNQSSCEPNSSTNRHRQLVQLLPNQEREAIHSHSSSVASNSTNEFPKPGSSSMKDAISSSATSETSACDISLANQVQTSLKLLQAKQSQTPSDKGKTVRKKSSKSITATVPKPALHSRSRTRSSDSNSEANTLLQGIGFIDKSTDPPATNEVITIYQNFSFII